MCRGLIATVCVTCVKVDVFSAETAEAPVPVLKRPPAHEVTQSTERRGADEGTSPKGIIHWVVIWTACMG